MNSCSLGPLEKEIMNCLWEGNAKKVRDIYRCLRKKKKMKKEYKYFFVLIGIAVSVLATKTKPYLGFAIGTIEGRITRLTGGSSKKIGFIF